MPRVRQIALDNTTRHVSLALDFYAVVAHVFNYTSYNIYISNGSNLPNQASAFQIVAPNSIGIVPLYSDVCAFVLDVIGIPSITYPAQIKIYDELVPVEVTALPQPIGSLLSNLVFITGDKSGAITANVSSFTDITGVTLSTTVPTGKCLLFFRGILRCSGNRTFYLDLLVNGSPVNSSGTSLGVWTRPMATNVDEEFNILIPINGLDTIASHTFKARWRESSTGETMTLQNSASNGTYNFGVLIP